MTRQCFPIVRHDPDPITALTNAEITRLMRAESASAGSCLRESPEWQDHIDRARRYEAEALRRMGGMS